jgi:hypothetical protein
MEAYEMAMLNVSRDDISLAGTPGFPASTAATIGP